MDKLNLTIDLDNLTEKEREKFFKLVEKSKKSEKSSNPFERVEKNKSYYYIDDWSRVMEKNEVRFLTDAAHFEICNYYSNKEFAGHQALRELLNRKLMKFSYENGGAEIDNCDDVFSICRKSNHILCQSSCVPDILTPLFVSEEVAQRAIDEVVKPFLEEYPNFKWWG